MRVLSVLLVVALCGVEGAFAEPEDQVFEQAKKTLSARLKDPESARFRNLVYMPATTPGNTDIVCGWTNARNSFGGYVGFRPFYVMGDSAEVRDDESAGWLDNHTMFDAIWSICSPPTKERFGSALVALPDINVQKQCKKNRKASAERPQLYANCEQNEMTAREWLQEHQTRQGIADQCSREARRYDSYSMAKSCVERLESDIVFRRGPPADLLDE